MVDDSDVPWAPLRFHEDFDGLRSACITIEVDGTEREVGIIYEMFAVGHNGMGYFAADQHARALVACYEACRAVNSSAPEKAIELLLEECNRLREALENIQMGINGHLTLMRTVAALSPEDPVHDFDDDIFDEP